MADHEHVHSVLSSLLRDTLHPIEADTMSSIIGTWKVVVRLLQYERKRQKVRILTPILVFEGQTAKDSDNYG